MTTPHKATPEQWQEVENWAGRSLFSCVLELDGRLANLEARRETQHTRINDLFDKFTALANKQDDDLQPCLRVVKLVNPTPTPPPAPDHFRGDREMVATDDELQRLWNTSIGYVSALRTIYNLGRQHGAKPRHQWAEMLREEADR